MDPHPWSGRPGGFDLELGLQFRAGKIAVPPGAYCDPGITDIKTIAIDMQPLTPGSLDPLGDRFIGRIATVTIVVAGTHDENRFFTQEPEILLHDRNLYVSIKRRRKIKKISSYHHHIKIARLG